MQAFYNKKIYENELEDDDDQSVESEENLYEDWNEEIGNFIEPNNQYSPQKPFNYNNEEEDQTEIGPYFGEINEVSFYLNCFLKLLYLE